MTAKTTAEVVKKLFKKDFLLFKETTIGEKIRDVTVEADHSTRSILNLFINLSRCNLFDLIIILLISTSSTISILIIGGLMIISALIFISYSAFIRKLGIALVKSREILFNKIFEISNLIREIKILKKDNFLLRNITLSTKNSYKENYKKLLILSIPKHIIEICAVFFYFINHF